MSDDYFGDFDIFLDGEWFIRLRGMTYGDVLDWSWPIVRDNPLLDIEICVCFDGD